MKKIAYQNIIDTLQQKNNRLTGIIAHRNDTIDGMGDDIESLEDLVEDYFAIVGRNEKLKAENERLKVAFHAAAALVG